MKGRWTIITVYSYNFITYSKCFCFVFVWCPCMAIDVISLQHNGRFLPGTILSTQCYYHGGTRLNTMKRFCICSLRSHLNALTFFPLTGGCSEGLEAFGFFFKQTGQPNGCRSRSWHIYTDRYHNFVSTAIVPT